MQICLHDPAVIEDFLRQNTGLYLYLLGDLDDFYWRHTSWYGWQENDGLKALALLYTGDSLPVLLALGQDRMPELLNALEPLLPRRFYCHLSPGLEPHLKAWKLSGGEHHYRMLLTQPEKLAELPQSSRAEGLSRAEQAEIEAFYQAAYPHNWFNARMLASGQYLGLRKAQQLVAIAGVHVYAPAQGVAALGNIAVSPAERGQGLAAEVTGALCRQLQQSVKAIGLNVHAANTPALRCYARLGFEICAEYQEWMAEPT